MGRWGQIVGDTGDAAGRELTGTGSFRLMPGDDMAPAPAAAIVRTAAGGHALVLTYEWTHPSDGRQDGVLLVGSPGDDATDQSVEASLIDSWHQQPGPMRLTGTVQGAVAELAGTYAQTWGWQVRIDLTSPDELVLVMRNVIPAEAVAQAPADSGIEAGPYDVMHLHLHRS